MVFIGSDNMTKTIKYPCLYQKINGICAFKTIPADNLKIEIPINIILTGATYNKVNKVNKLVTVFAVSPCSYDSFVP
jgi:hypothetical protein